MKSPKRRCNAEKERWKNGQNKEREYKKSREASPAKAKNLSREIEKVKTQITSQRGNWTGKPILECKAILDLKPINDAKGYRVWNKKFKKL